MKTLSEKTSFEDKDIPVREAINKMDIRILFDEIFSFEAAIKQNRQTILKAKYRKNKTEFEANSDENLEFS